MKTILVSASVQIELMEFLAESSGHTDYEAVREEMSEALYQKHGKHTSFDFEQISKKEKKSFIQWLKQDD